MAFRRVNSINLLEKEQILSQLFKSLEMPNAVEVQVFVKELEAVDIVLPQATIEKIQQSNLIFAQYKAIAKAMSTGKILKSGNFDYLKERQDIGLIAKYCTLSASKAPLTQSRFMVILSQLGLIKTYPEQVAELLAGLDRIVANIPYDRVQELERKREFNHSPTPS
jgi:hypothetical protein